MKNQLFNRRIPTILGVGLVLLGIVLTTIIVKVQTGFRSTASSSEVPQNVKITNLSDSSFTITYTTDADTTGSVGYGTSKQLGNTQLEDSDTGRVHSIIVQKLSPLTKYYLVIVSGQNTFLNNGVPFEISTGPSISSTSATKIAIKGKVILPNGNAPNEALAYLSADNSQILSASVAKNGEFNFDLKGFRTDDLSSYFEVREDTVLKLFATNNSLESTVLFSLNKTGSIPTITLSNDYNFTKAYIPAASSSARIGFPSITKSENLKPQILTPKKDQSFTDQKPQFKGTSLPNENVEIIIHSEENIQTIVTADSNGNWTYRPPNNLSPGVHTITIKTRDSAGILTTIMQSFTVFAQEQQISESATPTSKPTITPTPTPTPVLIVTDMPIESKGGLAPTGDSSFLLVIGGIITTVVGIVLLLLTRTVL